MEGRLQQPTIRLGPQATASDLHYVRWTWLGEVGWHTMHVCGRNPGGCRCH